MFDLYEILDEKDFIEIAKKQRDGLKKKFEATHDQGYMKAYKQLSGLIREYAKKREFCVPFIRSDCELGFHEFSNIDDAKTYRLDARNERLMNYV